MKINNSIEKNFFSKWIVVGYSFRRIAFGFSIDKYHMDIDLIFVWFGIEF